MLTYQDAVRELYFSLYGNDPANYHALLYRLLCMADRANKALLRLAYPMEVQALEEWQNCANEWEFFSQCGLFRSTGDLMRVKNPKGGTMTTCRLCLAKKGLKGTELPERPVSQKEFFQHLREAHGIEVKIEPVEEDH